MPMKSKNQKETVLVVDDDPQNIQNVQNIVKTRYRVKSALNGHEALQIILSDNPPDIILLDVIMPGLNGFQVAKRIKSEPRTKDIPIIFITLKTGSESLVKGFQIGAQDYVTKPFQPEELLARVETHLMLKRQREQLESINLFLEDRVTKRTEQLQKALQNKDHLLKELHHRVKNNLQILMSLLRMQIYDRKSTEMDAEMLTTYLHRIQTMSLANEMMDVKGNIKTVHVKQYLSNLLHRIIEGNNRTWDDIRVKLEADDTMLDVNAIIPCGFIINELVSNVLKYAIPQNRKGKINVSFRSSSNKTRVLRLQHDGKGLSKPIDFDKATTIGFKLIDSLTKQLQGTISYKPREQLYTLTFGNPRIKTYNQVHDASYQSK